MPASWEDDGDPNKPDWSDPGPVNRLELPQGSGWPSRLGGYAKSMAVLIGGLGATGVLAWLETAGVTHLPGWAEAGITAGVGLLAVLFGPRNRA